MTSVKLTAEQVAQLQAAGRLPKVVKLDWSGQAGPTERPKMPRVDWPAGLAHQAVAAGLPAPEREYRFHTARRWRFDLAWPDLRVAVEVDGGAFAGGRHTRGAGFREDCVKLCEAGALGWRVLRVMPEHVRDGSALAWVERALAFALAAP